MKKSVSDGHSPAGWDERLPVLAANPGNLFDDVGIGKMVPPAPPLVAIPITDALGLEAIDLIEGNLRAAPVVTPRACSGPAPQGHSILAKSHGFAVSGSAARSSLPENTSEASRAPERDPSLAIRGVKRLLVKPLRVTSSEN